MLTIAKNQRNFKKDGKPFFYLADTCWSAFTNIHEEDWHYYLMKRKEQGFNTLQINILPQWDASSTTLSYEPFLKQQDGSFDPTQLQDTYFEHAHEMCVTAKSYGFTLALVVLWCNYVPNTWASKMNPSWILPKHALQPYFQKVLDTFHDVEPIYVISGDTNFSNEASVYYEEAFSYMKPRAKDSLFTMHIQGRCKEIPEQFVPQMDFYMYQSGHNAEVENRNMAADLALHFYHNYPKKPIINAEPCYEQMGYSRQMYGRFQPFDIRRAAWMSLLSGACAGVAYGAAGIYSWHSATSHFNASMGEGFDVLNPWQQALLYPGAWDYGFLKYFMQTYQIEELSVSSLLQTKKDGICCAETKNQEILLIYVPYATKLILHKALHNYECTIFDFEHHHIANGMLEIREEETQLPAHSFTKDCLYILKKGDL